MHLVTRIAVVAMLGLTACTGGRASHDGAGQDRLAVIRALRGIDTCALYGGAETVAGRAMTLDGPTSILGCRARIADPRRDVEATIAVNIAPAVAPKTESWVKQRSIDGVDVTSASLWDTPNAPPRDQTVSWSCSFTAHFGDRAQIMVIVQAPPDADACAIGEELTHTAIGAYRQRPQWDSSTFPRTVLTGADPCAGVDRLAPQHRIDWDTDNFTVDACSFSVDGGPVMEVSVGYGDPALLDVATDQFTLAGHRVAGDDEVVDVVVGDQFRLADKTLIPQVTVVDPGKDKDRIRLVAQAVAEHYS